MPSIEAKLLALLAMAAYVAAAAMTLLAIAARRDGLRRPAGAVLVAGVSLSLASIVLRIAQGYWPTASGFDTFSLLALLCGAAAAYFRAVDTLPRVATAVAAIAAAWSALAVAMGGAAYHPFARDVWAVMHISVAASSAVAFAAAAVGGWMYLRKHKQLRTRDPRMFSFPLPSLERLDRFVRQVLPVAFVLVTATIVTGLVGVLQPEHRGYFHKWATHPKVLLAAVTWSLYTAALVAAHARRFRAHATAVLAIVGFFLLAAVLVATVVVLPRM
jgi:ABC-type uncharacterized transport system permease subunit